MAADSIINKREKKMLGECTRSVRDVGKVKRMEKQKRSGKDL